MIVGGHCVVVGGDCNAEFLDQVKQIDLDARTVKTFKVNVHNAVHEIDVDLDFAVCAVFIGEVNADFCFETFENGLDVKVEIFEIDVGQIAQTDCVKVEFCTDVELEAVVDHVGQHKAEPETSEQITDAERIVDLAKADVAAFRADANLREHGGKDALQLIHIEQHFEQLVEREAVTDVVSVCVLHETIVVCVLGVSVLG